MSSNSVRLVKCLSIAALLIPIFLHSSLDTGSFWLLILAVSAIAVVAQFAKASAEKSV